MINKQKSRPATTFIHTTLIMIMMLLGHYISFFQKQPTMLINLKKIK